MGWFQGLDGLRLAIFIALLLVALAFAWEDCPFGLVNDTFPGQCGRYVDTNNDGICDHSQAAPQELPAAEPDASLVLNATNTAGAAQASGQQESFRLFFIGHAVASAISALLIIVLAAQLRLKRMQYHRQIAYAMAFFGVAGLLFSLLAGFRFTPDIYGAHNASGFVALGLSLAPMLVRSKDGLHCKLAYAAAFFAVVATITGVLAYAPLIAGLAA